MGAPEMEDAAAGGAGAVLTADLGRQTSGFRLRASGFRPSISAGITCDGMGLSLGFRLENKVWEAAAASGGEFAP